VTAAALPSSRSARLASDSREHIGTATTATKTVILIAIFAGLAIAAGAIIVAKVISKANSIPTN